MLTYNTKGCDCMKNLTNFLTYCRVVKDLSPNTVDSYKRSILKFYDFVEDVLYTSPQTIHSYIEYLDESGYKRSSINLDITILKVFFTYLVKQAKVMTSNPTEDVRAGNNEKRLPKCITPEQTARLLKTAKKKNIKHYLYIEIMYILGARVSELINIKVSDIDFENGLIYLVGKGNKERVNPVTTSCLGDIRQYMEAKGITEGYLFPSNSESGHVSRESVFNAIKRIAKAARIDSKLISPHTMRHSFAQHMLDNGCDMAVVQDFLGHENISTTRIYATVTVNKKTTEFKKFHPLSN